VLTYSRRSGSCSAWCRSCFGWPGPGCC